MSQQFCGVCGNKTSQHKPMSWWCETCGQRYFDSPHPCADLWLFDEQGRLLVSRRAENPGKGLLDLPGGFVDFGETFEQAAKREVNEELGLGTDDYTQPVYFASYLTDYPWKKVVYKTVTAVFVAHLKAGAQPQALDEIAEVLFLNKADIHRRDFSFPGQVDMIAGAAKLIGANW